MVVVGASNCTASLPFSLHQEVVIMPRTSLIQICITLLACIVFAGSNARAQTIWHVDDDGPNDPGPGDPGISDPLEDGSSDHPYDAIQEGIDVAVDGDTVLVADGNYTGPGNRDIDFHGKLITVRSADDDWGDCQINCAGEGIGFYFRNGETAEAVLEGLRIIGAHVTASNSGAVVCDGASPTIRRCHISGSDRAGLFCRNGAPTVELCWVNSNSGAGVYCNNGAPTLFECFIFHNSAEGVKSEYSDPILTQCSVWDNAENGIFCDRGSLEITSCGVSENERFGVSCDHAELLMTTSDVSENGYAGIYCSDGSSVIHGCSIHENLFIPGAGGGILIDGGDAKISHSTISRNVGHVWGGVSFWGNNLEVSDCTITRNIAVHPVAMSAGILVGPTEATIRNCTIAMNLGGYLGGGMYVEGACVTVCNSVVARNDSTGRGGGIYCEWGGDVALINSTIVENTSGWDGSALYCWGSSATLVNSIVRDNWDPDGLPFVFDEWDTPTLLAISHCNIEDGEAAVYVYDDAALFWGPGNIDADPLFVDPGESDYHLGPGSPCIDAGCNCGVPLDAEDADGDGDVDEFVPFDLDGEGRFFDDPNTPDSGSGLPPIVDMGAYEFGGSDLPPCRGDLDGDRDIDMADLSVLLANYGMSEGAGGAEGDMDCDGDVALADLGALLSRYGTSCP
jgi:hypothetical protein